MLRERPWIRATPRTAPRAFAPVSPSMDSPLRSGASSPRDAPAAAAAAAGPRGALGPPMMAMGTPTTRPTFSALPGRRSKRLTRLAAPAITAPPMRASPALTHEDGSGSVAPSLARDSRSVMAADISPTTPRPATFTSPVVMRPSRAARRCPLRPLLDGSPTRSSRAPSAPAPRAATTGATPATDAPIASPITSAGPSRRVTGRPAWLTRCHGSRMDCGRSRLTAYAMPEDTPPTAAAHKRARLTVPHSWLGHGRMGSGRAISRPIVAARAGLSLGQGKDDARQSHAGLGVVHGRHHP